MSSKKFKPVDHSQFVVTGPFVDVIFKGGSYAMSVGYVDHAGVISDSTQQSKQKGRYVEYVIAKDDKGRDKAKRFRFDQSLGRLLTRPSDTDIYGKSQYEFLKNHPECEGSPNGTYEDDGNGGKIQVGVSFRELNTAKDAAIALRADRLRNQAETSALSLDEQTLEEIANIIGYYGEVDDQMLLKVVEFARKKPGEYLELLKSDDRGVRAIIRKSIVEGIFRQHGPLIKWNDLTVGNDEDDAVATLRKDKQMLSALREKLGLDAVDTKVKTSKKRQEQVSL